MIRALRDIKTIWPAGKLVGDERATLNVGKSQILRAAKAANDEIRRIISVYDKAYDYMIEEKNPRLFREFLLGAPMLFLEIGEKMGMLQHITSLWQYRFAAGASRHVDVEELIAIFQDFTKGLVETRKAA